MSFERYNTKCRIGATFELPVDHMEIRPRPFVGGGGTVVQLFDGRNKLITPTWVHVITLNWKELGSHYDEVWDAVNHMLINDGADFYAYFDGSIFDATKVVTGVIPDLKENNLGIIFDSRIRKRPASLTLITKTAAAAPLSWVVD